MPRPIPLAFSGPRLDVLRARAGLSMEALAQRCTDHGHQVHPSTVGKHVRGVQKPMATTVAAYATALNVDIRDLLDESPDEQKAVSA